MPAYPESVIRKAAEAALRRHKSEHPHSHLRWQDFASEVTAVLDAVAEDLGQHAAGKILAHMEAHGPSPEAPGVTRHEVLRRAWRRHFGTAARVAAFAFLSEDDLKAIAARELAAGNFVACQAPEGSYELG
jgi:hypothetical protein